MRVILEVDVEKITGKFASADEVGDAIRDLVDGQSLSVGDNSEYEVVSVDVAAAPRKRKSAEVDNA